MKNNKLLVLLATSMLMLTSCGGASNEPTSDGSSTTPTSSQTTSSDGGSSESTSNSETSSGSTSTSQGGGQSVQTDNLKSLSELKNNLGHYFMFEYNPTTDITHPNTFVSNAEKVTWATDNRYTVREQFSGQKTLWERITGFDHQYTKVGSKYMKLGMPISDPDDPDKHYAESFSGNMLFQNVDSIEYTSKANVTFLNRSAVKYTLEKELNGGHLFSESIIDNETGFTLRLYNSYQGDHIEQLKTNFETTLLTFTHSDVDAYIALETANIGLRYWDSTFLTSVGFTSELTLPDGVLYFTDYKDNYDDYHYQDIYWFVSGADLNAKINASTALVQAMYNAGAKYTEAGTLKSPWDNEYIYYLDTDDNEFIFDAYTGSIEGSGRVSVSSKKTTFMNESAYKLEIELYVPIA